MTQTALSEQLAKLNPDSGASQLLGRVRAEQAVQQQAQAAARGPSLRDEIAQTEADTATREAEQADLEARHGKLATAGTQFGRGVLDALLTPGALVGATAEGAGHATGWSGLENFGRDLGTSSSGDSAIEAAAFLFGGGGKAGLTTAERVAKDVDEQQRAWPALAAVSHVTGMVAPAMVGGLASTGAKGIAAIGLGATEGAGAGAQAAYERNEPLRDVLSSTLTGAVLGGATAGTFEGLSSVMQSKALKAAARELAEDQNLAAVGLQRSSLSSLVGDEAGALDAKAGELASELSNYRFQSGPLEGKSIIRALRTPEQLAPGVEQAAQETQAALSSMADEVVTKAAANPETAHIAASINESVKSAPGQTAKLVEDAIQALGGDPASFQALKKTAQNFQDLSEIIKKAGSSVPESGALDALPSIVGVGKMLAGSNPLAAVAHSVLTKIGQNVVKERAASTVATLANSMVLDTVSTALKQVVPSVEIAAGGVAGKAGEKLVRPKPLTPEEEHERYQEQLDRVNKAVTAPDPEERMDTISKIGDLPAPLVLAASGDMHARMAQLQADMPKPEPNIRGKAYETLSLQQVKMANSMFEATVRPMSVFTDFASGVVDYNKVQYAWKQYPGLQKACQAGLMDIFQTQLTDEKRGRVPDTLLTQLDNLFGFDGSLQPTLNRQFASRMDQLLQTPQNNPPPRPGGKLQLPGSQPTFTERLSGQR
jgi:hypothetical protein